MHGRKKADKLARTPQEDAIESVKLKKFWALAGACMDLRAAQATGPKAMEVNAKLLSFNPDFYTCWNHRKEMLVDLWEKCDDDTRAKSVQGELKLTALALAERNPKSYCAWSHRQWVVSRNKVDLMRELALTADFHEKDERNFHCWNYRRWIAAKAGVSPEKELEYTKFRLESNFSNYSAWHYRTALIPKVHGDSLPAILDEIEYVHGAMFTEPDDQSAWFYYRWLLQQVAKHTAGESKVDAEDALRKQVEFCQELLEEEPSCKWPMTSLAYLGKILKADVGQKELVRKLRDIDGRHARYYDYLTSTSTSVSA